MKTNHVNRRDFFRLSATAGVSAMLIPGARAARASLVTANENEIPVRTLGRTGVKLPILSMGVMRADNPNVVRAAYNSGIFHFDTAHGYQNGKNEEMLGKFFTGKPRDSFFIATKGKFDYPLKDDFEETYEKLVDQSLKRLNMDHVDLFYTHALDKVEEVKDERVIAVLKKFKEDGKTRFLGFSAHAGKPELLDAAIEAGIYDVVLLSYNFKLSPTQIIWLPFADRKCCIASSVESAGHNAPNIFLFLILCGLICMPMVINIQECRKKHWQGWSFRRISVPTATLVR